MIVSNCQDNKKRSSSLECNVPQNHNHGNVHQLREDLGYSTKPYLSWKKLRKMVKMGMETALGLDA